MTKKPALALLTLTLVSGSLAACSGGGGGTSAQPADNKKVPAAPEPVTITLYNTQTLNDEDFQKLFADPVKKKYPHITVEWIKPAKGTEIADLLVAGTVPDLITTYIAALPDYDRLNLLQDQTALIKKQQMDVGRFEPMIIDSVRALSDKGELLALPYVNQFKALYYNKDIFDKMGVPYPKDGMTWEDAIALARQLSRTDGGVAYRGLDYDNVNRLSHPFAVNLVDPKTNKTVFNTDAMRTIFETGRAIYQVPGNMPAKITSGSTDEFFKTQTLAMMANINFLDRAKDAIGKGMRMGITQYPSFKEKPNIFGMVDAQLIFVPKGSKHQEDAMRVIQTLTSDEVQLISARQTARNSPLVNPEMRKQFAADMDYLKGIDMSPIFKSSTVPSPVFSKYFSSARTIMEDTFREYVKNGMDTNTALRLGEDRITQMVTTESAKSK